MWQCSKGCGHVQRAKATALFHCLTFLLQTTKKNTTRSTIIDDCITLSPIISYIPDHSRFQTLRNIIKHPTHKFMCISFFFTPCLTPLNKSLFVKSITATDLYDKHPAIIHHTASSCIIGQFSMKLNVFHMKLHPHMLEIKHVIMCVYEAHTKRHLALTSSTKKIHMYISYASLKAPKGIQNQ